MFVAEKLSQSLMEQKHLYVVIVMKNKKEKETRKVNPVNLNLAKKILISYIKGNEFDKAKKLLEKIVLEEK